jgi:hypothetical protein
MKIVQLVILLLIGNSVFSQTESLRNQVLQYDNSKSELITKARRILADKFIEGNIQEIQKWRNYLIDSLESSEYLALYEQETDLLAFWTEDYQLFLNKLKVYNSSLNRINKITPVPDNLYRLLISKTTENYSALLFRIDNSQFSEEEKSVAKMYLMLYIADLPELNITQDTLNHYANNFLNSFPASEYRNFINNNVRNETKKRAISGGLEFIVGGGTLFTGRLNNYFRNGYSLGIGFEIYYKRMGLLANYTFSFSRTKRDIIINKQGDKWGNGSKTSILLGNLSLGFVAIDKNTIKIIPHGGIGIFSAGPTTKDQDKNPLLEDYSIDKIAYVGGVTFDYKFNKKKKQNSYWIYRGGSPYNYVSLRVRYCFYYPQFSRSSDFFGFAHNLTVGFNMYLRNVKRKI